MSDKPSIPLGTRLVLLGQGLLVGALVGAIAVGVQWRQASDASKVEQQTLRDQISRVERAGSDLANDKAKLLELLRLYEARVATDHVARDVAVFNFGSAQKRAAAVQAAAPLLSSETFRPAVSKLEVPVSTDIKGTLLQLEAVENGFEEEIRDRRKALGLE